MLENGESKNFDFERVCVDRKTAEHVLEACVAQYKNHPKWEVGRSEITELPNGEFKVYVELKFTQLEDRPGMHV